MKSTQEDSQCTIFKLNFNLFATRSLLHTFDTLTPSNMPKVSPTYRDFDHFLPCTDAYAACFAEHNKNLHSAEAPRSQDHPVAGWNITYCLAGFEHVGRPFTQA